jgi:carbonic anhydrase/acetyltransferase-like protein (isoleucine patch superfamily)
MLLELQGKRPRIDPRAWVAPTAVVRGDVVVGAGSVVLDGAVLTAESGAVRIGQECVVMECAVLRGVVGHECVLGDGVLVGPHTHLSGCTVEDEVFIATRASIFNGARLGRASEVRIGAVVHVNSQLTAETMVPIGWVAVGDPAQLFPPEAHDALWPIQKAMRFGETVWGSRHPPRQGESIRRYAAGLRQRLGSGRGLATDGDDPLP